mmetsp:Transcript_51283/g.132315  ORF Transcript_51283/g.132315 Transcript_51283/m.132315 type:complete len:293 (-) Transcript_51283:324-1202(-)
MWDPHPDGHHQKRQKLARLVRLDLQTCAYISVDALGEGLLPPRRCRGGISGSDSKDTSDISAESCSSVRAWVGAVISSAAVADAAIDGEAGVSFRDRCHADRSRSARCCGASRRGDRRACCRPAGDRVLADSGPLADAGGVTGAPSSSAGRATRSGTSGMNGGPTFFDSLGLCAANGGVVEPKSRGAAGRSVSSIFSRSMSNAAFSLGAAFLAGRKQRRAAAAATKSTPPITMPSSIQTHHCIVVPVLSGATRFPVRLAAASVVTTSSRTSAPVMAGLAALSTSSVLCRSAS